VLAPDWGATIVKANIVEDKSDLSDAGSSAGLLRIIRVVRVLRLLRFAKVGKHMHNIEDSFNTEYIFLMLDMFKLCLAIVLMNHIMGSTWYLVGDISRVEKQHNWIEAAGIANEPLGLRYSACLRWSLAHFTLATSPLQAHNSLEQVFSIFAMMVGVVIFCVFLSMITRFMVKQEHKEQLKQSWLLRRYIREKSISEVLRFKILRYVDYVVPLEEGSLSETRVTLLDKLSETLRIELAYEVKFNIISHHPVVAAVQGVSPPFVCSLVQSVLSAKRIGKDDLVVRRGMMAPCMYFLTKGQMRYTGPACEATPMQTNDFLCEMALWVAWAVRGKCWAETACEMIFVDAKAFNAVAQEEVAVCSLLSSYVEVYVKTLNDWQTELNDLNPSTHKAELPRGHGQHFRLSRRTCMDVLDHAKERRDTLWEGYLGELG
jgi:hypothetical protein